MISHKFFFIFFFLQINVIFRAIKVLLITSRKIEKKIATPPSYASPKICKKRNRFRTIQSELLSQNGSRFNHAYRSVSIIGLTLIKVELLANILRTV